MTNTLLIVPYIAIILLAYRCLKLKDAIYILTEKVNGLIEPVEDVIEDITVDSVYDDEHVDMLINEWEGAK